MSRRSPPAATVSRATTTRSSWATAATASITQMPDSIMRGSTKILSYGAYDIAMNDNIATLVPHQQYGMTMTLILIVLLLNITAIVIRSKVAKKLRG